MTKILTHQERSDAVRSQLTKQGLHHAGTIHVDLSTPELYETAIRHHEGRIGFGGVLVVETGQYTGRSVLVQRECYKQPLWLSYFLVSLWHRHETRAAFF